VALTFWQKGGMVERCQVFMNCRFSNGLNRRGSDPSLRHHFRSPWIAAGFAARFDYGL
jgi:hypothetical protein